MRRSHLLSALGFVAISGAVLLLALGGNESSTDGPLDAGSPGTYGQKLEVGDRYSAGHVLLSNYGDKPAVIERVRVLGVTDGLELLGIRTRPVPGAEGGMFVGDVGFPPQNYLTKPLSQQNLVPAPEEFSPEGEPIGGLELAIGVKATRPAVARSRAVEVTYRVGDKRYREEFLAEIYLCAPQEDFPGTTCPGDSEGQFSDDAAG